MGVPPKIPLCRGPTTPLVTPLYREYQQGSGFFHISSNFDEDEEQEVTVYNLQELSEFPVNVDSEFGYYAIMDVGEPVTITMRKSSNSFLSSTFTTYLIKVESNFPSFSDISSTPFTSVRRRFQEFVWLRNQLEKNHPNRKIPVLPPKRFFQIFNPSFIRERLQGLGTFLQRVLESPTFLRDPSLLFFLKSDLSVEEMERKRLTPVSALNRTSACRNVLPEISISPISIPNSLHSEEEEDEEDLSGSGSEVESRSVLSSSPSEESGCGYNPPKIKISCSSSIPVPKASVVSGSFFKKGDEDHEDDPSSEGDSGQFEASSSPSSSTGGKSLRDRDTSPYPFPSSGLNDFLLYNPMALHVIP